MSSVYVGLSSSAIFRSHYARKAVHFVRKSDAQEVESLQNAVFADGRGLGDDLKVMGGFRPYKHVLQFTDDSVCGRIARRGG